MENVAEIWLGNAFEQLHPLLQEVHRRPATLAGDVDVVFGGGLAGALGRRLARRLGVPATPERHRLDVRIHSRSDGLHWERGFDGRSRFVSVFRPVGRHPDGHWVERSGGLTLILGVDVVDGAWHWVHRSTRLFGVPIPKALMPATRASKGIAAGRYRFAVEVRAPLLGRLFSYAGDLAPSAADDILARCGDTPAG